MRRILLLAAVSLALLGGGLASAAHKWNLASGTPDLRSAGQLAFGPDGVLFVGDPQAAAVFAIDTGDAKGDARADRNIEKLDAKLAELLGGSATVNDLAVNPDSGNIYLSVTTADKKPALVRIDGKGELSRVALENVPFQKAALPNPPEDKVTGEGPRARNRRMESITDLKYAEGKVYVAGITSDAAPSRLRELAFPFADADPGINVEIYHAAHGRVEDYAAIRTLLPMNIDGKPALLAGFTCTPLVRFEIDGVKSEKVRGTTVAELGNRNTPIDMISYERDGQSWLLMANTARGVMKISTEGIGRAEGLSEPVRGGGTAGQKFETIASLAGTVQLDRLGADRAVVLQQSGDSLALRTVPLP